VIRGPDGQERRSEHDKTKVTIGSNPLCDVPVADPGVDPEQCVLVAREDGFELFDIGESGGVLVNGKPAGQARIGPGDEIWVGATVLRLLPREGEAVAFTEHASTVREELAAPAPAPAAPVAARAAAKDERFALLNEVQKLIRAISHNENVFESILDTLFSSVPVRRGFLAIRDAEGELQVKAHRSREQGSSAGEKIEVSRTLIGRVLETGRSVLTSDAEADADFSAIRSIHRLRIKAAICVPLVVEGKVIGLVYGDNRERPGSLVKDHLSILSALASVAAVAVEKFRLLDEYHAKLKIEQALAIARSIQLNFLPARPPEAAGLDVWGASHSCDETGGDYFDYFPMEDGALGVAIADVTGHGIGPALLMATVRAALRVLIQTESSLERLLFRLNNLIRADVHDGRFITLFLGVLDARQGVFRHVGAGHTPPVWFKAADGSTHLVTSGGPPLGILAGLQYRQGADLPLQPGDLLLFTTDGIIEADDPDGAQFGFDRLQAVVAESAAGTAREVGEAVMASVEGFTRGRPLRDDATLVAVKVKS